MFGNGLREFYGGRKFPAAWTVGAYKIGIAELAHGILPVALKPRPEIAAGETEENGRASGLRALALERVVQLFDGIGHAPRNFA